MACIKIRKVLNALFKGASFCVTSLALATEQLSKWMQAEKQTNWTVSVRGLRIETDKWGDVGKWIRWGGVYQGWADEKPCSKHMDTHTHTSIFTKTEEPWCYLNLTSGPKCIPEYKGGTKKGCFFIFQHQKWTPQEEMTFITMLPTEMSPALIAWFKPFSFSL